MILKSEKNQVIIKYALLLTIIYAVQMVVSYSFKLVPKQPANNIENLVKNSIPFLMVIIGNLIAMYFVIKDVRRFQVKNKYLGWLTFIYCPVGVCILLIHFVLESGDKETE